MIISKSIILFLVSVMFISVSCEDSSPVGPSSNSVDGRRYYLIEEGYKCRPFIPNPTEKVETYKDSIYFRGDSVCFTGDGCNDAIACQNGLPDGLKISDDLETIEYKGQTYQYMEKSPF